MARIAVPDLPHHVTQRGNPARAGIFRGRRLSSLSPAYRHGGAQRPHSSLGLLADAQSRPPANHAHLA